MAYWQTNASSPHIPPSNYFPGSPPAPETTTVTYKGDDDGDASTVSPGVPPSTFVPSGPPTPEATTRMGDDGDASATPWDGGTYLIINIADGRALALVDGQLLMQPYSDTVHAAPDGCYHWHAVDSGGWLCFRNGCSGKYLGHDGRGSCTKRLRVSANHAMHWEHFNARLHPDGGFLLQMRHWEVLVMVRAQETGIVDTVGPGSSEGTRWKFVKV